MKTQPTYQVGSANKPGGKKHYPSEEKKKKKTTSLVCRSQKTDQQAKVCPK